MRKKTYLTTIRRAVQLLSFLFLSYIIWTTRGSLTGYIFSPAIYFKLDPFVIMITSIAERVLLPGLLLSVIMLLLAYVLGRAFCGWLCPLGAVYDMWARAVKMTVRRKYPETEPRKAVKIKYFILSGFALCAVFGVQLAWTLDPITIFVRTFSFNVHPFVNKLIDGTFITALQTFKYPAFLEKIYYGLKDNLIEITNPVFPHTWLILLFFAALLGLTLIKRRFWCRYICPLGAMLALGAKYSPFKRTVRSCLGKCSICRQECRMNAIRADNSYIQEECVLCLDCITKCPKQETVFAFELKGRLQAPQAKYLNGPVMSRMQFLVSLASSVMFLAGFKKAYAAGGVKPGRPVIRPPAALPEDEFIQRWIRCGNCMKVCVTNVLQPSLLESGFGGIWTPRLDTKIGYCEHDCVLCGTVCPTGAIAKLTVEQKRKTKIGTAAVNKNTCIAWSTGTECLVCEEHCPVAEKAIKIEKIEIPSGKYIGAPVVNASLCVGCAICEFNCPAVPKKAITVTPI